MPASTLYRYLHANGSLKAPERKLVNAEMRVDTGDVSADCGGDPIERRASAGCE